MFTLPSSIARYVKCAENRDTTSAGCSDLKVCVTNGTTQSDLLSTLFRAERLVLSSGALETVQLFGRQKCQVFASGIVGRTAKIIREHYTGDYVVGTLPFTRESLALVTNEEDVVFSKFVDAVVNAIIYADEQGITQDSYWLMRRIDLFRPLVSDAMFQNVIRAVGNFQEIWDRHTNPKGGLLRGQQNLPVTVPLGPMLMTVHRWDKPPMREPNL